MSQQPTPDPPGVQPLPYASGATPRPEKVAEALALIVFCQAAASVFIFLIAGASWPAAFAVVALAATAISLGYFLTHRE